MLLCRKDIVLKQKSSIEIRERIPELDVVRGLAILLVVAYHMPGNPIRGGALGVDLFMVLSGYLVTRQLAEREVAISTLFEFYRRRLRRIIPPVVVVVAICSVFVFFGAGWTRRSRLFDLASGVGFVANWRFVYSGTDYFNTVAGVSPVQHLWSLAVEEQFYLVWPIVILLTPRRARLLVVSGLAVASMLWLTVHASTWDSSRLYFGTDTRIFALAIGSALALLPNNTLCPKWIPYRALWRILLVCWVLTSTLIKPSSQFMYIVGYQAVAVFAALLIWTGIQNGENRSTSLSKVDRGLQIFGVRSFSIYLLHWPIFIELTEARVNFGGLRLLLLQLVVLVVASEILYRGVEMRIGNSLLGLKVAYSTILPVGAICGVFLVIVGTVAPAPPQYLSGEIRSDVNSPLKSLQKRVLIVGDSLVASLEPALKREFEIADLDLDVISISGCGLLPGVTVGEDGAIYEPSRQCERIVKENLWDKQPRISYEAILWLNAWDAEDRMISGELLKQHINQDEFANETEKILKKLKIFGDLVYLVPAAPRASKSSANPEGPSSYAMRRVIAAAETSRAIVKGNTNKAVKLLDLPLLLCQNHVPCRDTSSDGIRFRPLDGIHFDGPGASLVAESIVGQLVNDFIR